MSDLQSNNKRIAKNTLVIYANLFLHMLIGLFASRLVLEALGVSDFGLYNVAGGVVLVFSFISNSLAGTTFRFVNVEKGKIDGDINRVFNVCRVLHIAMAILLFLLIEIGGIWYINHYLNVEPGKEADAMFVFQVAAVVMGLGILNVPYSSLFNANEKFLFTTIVTLTGKLIEFILVIWLLHYNGNRLRAYAIIMITTTVLPFITYHFFSYRKWPEYVKWRFVKGWQHYKEAIVYSNYNLLSGAAGMARSQGSTLLINFFFGTVVNGAYAVAKSVEWHIASFANRFQEAANPQVTQSYSSGDGDRVYYLTSRIGKYSMLMMLLAFFPLWAEMEFVLDIWLVDVPDGAATFCRLILLMVLVAVADGGVGNVISASGRVASFRTAYSLLTLSCIPIGYFVLKAGAPAYVLLAIFIAADVIWRIVQLWLAHNILQFPVGQFCRETYLPVAIVSAPVVLCLFLCTLIPWDSTLWHLGRLLLILLLTAGADYFIGLRGTERERILSYLRKKLKRGQK